MTRSELVKESVIACLKRLNISFNKISEPKYHGNKVIQWSHEYLRPKLELLNSLETLIIGRFPYQMQLSFFL